MDCVSASALSLTRRWLITTITLTLSCLLLLLLCFVSPSAPEHAETGLNSPLACSSQRSTLIRKQKQGKPWIHEKPNECRCSRSVLLQDTFKQLTSYNALYKKELYSSALLWRNNTLLRHFMLTFPLTHLYVYSNRMSSREWGVVVYTFTHTLNITKFLPAVFLSVLQLWALTDSLPLKSTDSALFTLPF